MGCKFYFGAEKKEKEGNEMKKEKKLQRIGTHRDGKNGGGGWKSDFIGREQRKIARRGFFWEKAAGKALRNLLECMNFPRPVHASGESERVSFANMSAKRNLNRWRSV